MALVPALDLRDDHPNAPDAPDNRPPANVEAEQALLGALMYDNGALDLLRVDIQPQHFFEPFHQRLWESMTSAIRAGLLAEPIAFGEEFRRDPGFLELGGLRYLGDLVDRAPPAVSAPEYADLVFEMASLRTLIRIGEQMAAAARGKLRDADERRLTSAAIIEGSELDLLGLSVRGGSGRTNDLVDLGEAAGSVMAYVDDRSKPVGVRWGLNPIDVHVGTMMPGDLVLLGGRPSMGKSAVALATALNVAAPALADHMNNIDYDGRPPRGVLEVHAEMSFDKDSGGQVARRHLADIGYGLFGKDFPTYRALRDKNVSVDQRAMLEAAANNLRDVPIRGIKRTGIKLSTLRSIARRQIAAWARVGIEPGFMLVDHVGLLRADGRVSGRYEAQTEIAIGMKELADELGMPVLALVQLGRAVEQRPDKHPELSDLRDSGAWEENADVVAFVYRDAYYASREAEPAESDQEKWATWDQRKRSKAIEIIPAKVREGESGGKAEVWGDLGWNAIRSREPDFKGGLGL